MVDSADLRQISDAINSSMGQFLSGFKQAASENNNNLTKIVRDIARSFSDQKRDITSLTNVLEENLTETQQVASRVSELNNVFQESVAIQTSMLGELKSVSTSIKILNDSTENLNNSIVGGGANSVTGLLGGILRAFDFIPGAFRAAVAGLAFGAAGSSINNLMGSGAGGGRDAQLSGAGGSFNAEKAAALIRKVGGNEQEATMLGAISQPESGGNPKAHNYNPSTGDNSYGLWQINMLDKLGPERRAKYGISNNEQLKDPETNARIALQMLREAHGTPRDWTTWKHGKHLPYMQAAAAGAAGRMSETSTPKDDATATTSPAQTASQATPTTPGSSNTPNQESRGILNQEGGGRGPITSTAGAGDAKQFLQARETGRGDNTGVQAEKLDGEFASRLMKAIQAAERATGTKVGITEGYRDPHVQAQYYADYKGTPITYDGKTYQPNPAKLGRLAAPPGRSNHQKGMAADLTESPAREWIRVHASEFGLRQLGARDMPHFELAGASARAAESTSQTSYSVGGAGATPVSGGSPITPGMGGEATPSISEQAMGAAPSAPSLNPESQQMLEGSIQNLTGGGMGMGMMGMGGMGGVVGSLTPTLMSLLGNLTSSASAGEMQSNPSFNETQLVNNNAQSYITNQIQEAAVNYQAQQEMGQQAPTPTAISQADIAVAPNSMRSTAGGYDYNHPGDNGWPDWASSLGHIGFPGLEKIKLWG